MQGGQGDAPRASVNGESQSAVLAQFSSSCCTAVSLTSLRKRVPPLQVDVSLAVDPKGIFALGSCIA